MFYLLLPLALAEEPAPFYTAQPGYPGAHPVDAGHGQVGLAAGIALPGLVGHVGAEVGLTDRLSLGATGGITSSAGDASGNLRYDLVHRDNVHVGLFAGYGGLVLGSDGDRVHGPMLGFALEGGGERVRFDLTVPVILSVEGLSDIDELGLPALGSALMGTRVGASWRLSPHNHLRVGFRNPATPALDYTWTSGHLYAGAGAGVVMFTAPEVHGVVGWRF